VRESSIFFSQSTQNLHAQEKLLRTEIMFAWANQKLTEIAVQLAPPANDPAHKFLAACSTGDEQGALMCLDPSYATEECPALQPHQVIGNAQKGMQPVHHAAAAGMVELMRALLTHYRIAADTFDYEGNTPLHHACKSSEASSQFLAFVQMLVNEFGASVVVQNGTGQTPYDCATRGNVRNWLLPIQLQLETKKALETGVGLIPGQDLGGFRPKTLAPPPSGFSNAPAPYVGSTGGDAVNALMHPPGVRPPTSQPYAQAPPHSSEANPPMNFSPQQGSTVVAGPANVAVNAPPMDANAHTNQPPVTQAAATPAQSQNYRDPPRAAPAPSAASGTTTSHARFNTKKPISGNLKYRPDGFHSSSSDTALQAKYGHLQVDYSNVPPPPTSGGGTTSSGAMPPAPFSYSAYGNNNATSNKNRYPVYAAAGSGQGMGLPTNPPNHASYSNSAPNSFGYGQNASPNVNVYTPGMQHQNPANAPPQQSYSVQQQMPAAPVVYAPNNSPSVQQPMHQPVGPSLHQGGAMFVPPAVQVHHNASPHSKSSVPMPAPGSGSRSHFIQPVAIFNKSPVQGPSPGMNAQSHFSSPGISHETAAQAPPVSASSNNTGEHEAQGKGADVSLNSMDGEFVDLNLGGEEGAFQWTKFKMLSFS
jgi:hypothetical protein